MASYMILCLLPMILSLYSVHGVYPGDGYKTLLQQTFGKTPPDVKCNGKCGDAVFLTPYLKAGNITAARCASRVRTKLLPCVKSYAGFLTINEKDNSNIWFWYFPASDVPVNEAPLLVYTSSEAGLGVGLDIFTIAGPYIFNGSKPQLIKNKYTWSKRQSIVFFDAPLGAGFSYTDNEDAYATDEITVAVQLYLAMEQFLQIFTEVKDADVTVMGNFFGCRHMAALGYLITEYKKNNTPAFDIKNAIFFTGFFDITYKFNDSSLNLELGYFNQQTANKVREIESSAAQNVKSGNLAAGILLYAQAIQILGARKTPNPLNIPGKPIAPSDLYVNFEQRPDVRNFLHVGDTKLQLVDKAYDKLQTEIYAGDSRQFLNEILNNFPVLFNTGAVTPIAPYLPEQIYYESLSFDSVNEFRNSTRYIYNYDGLAVGYYAEAKNIISLVYPGLGNIITYDHPQYIEQMIYTYSRNSKLST